MHLISITFLLDWKLHEDRDLIHFVHQWLPFITAGDSRGSERYSNLPEITQLVEAESGLNTGSLELRSFFFFFSLLKYMGPYSNHYTKLPASQAIFLFSHNLPEPSLFVLFILY